MQFKNASDKPFALDDVDWFWGWTIQFEDEAMHGPWRLHLLVQPQPPLLAPRLCKPGETVEVTVDLGKDAYAHDFEWLGMGQGQPLKQLDPGKYRLSIGIPMKEPQHSQQAAPFWTGTINAEPVEFEITDKPAATQPGVGLSQLVGQQVTLTGADTLGARFEGLPCPYRYS